MKRIKRQNWPYLGFPAVFAAGMWSAFQWDINSADKTLMFGAVVLGFVLSMGVVYVIDKAIVRTRSAYSRWRD